MKDAVGFSNWLFAEGACSEAIAWAHGKDLATAWTTCERGDWLWWLLHRAGYKWERATRAEYGRADASAWAYYRRVTAPEAAEYERAVVSARREYRRAMAEYEPTAWAEYVRAMDSALDDFERATAPARAEYYRATGPAWAEYNRVMAQETRRIVGDVLRVFRLAPQAPNRQLEGESR